MSDHAIYVIGWSYGPTPELRCTATPDAPCHIVDGVQVEECNAREWVDNVGLEDLVSGDMVGPPPWLVDTRWTDDGPEFRQAPLTSAQTQGPLLTHDEVLKAIQEGAREAIEVLMNAAMAGAEQGVEAGLFDARLKGLIS